MDYGMLFLFFVDVVFMVIKFFYRRKDDLIIGKCIIWVFIGKEKFGILFFIVVVKMSFYVKFGKVLYFIYVNF